MPSISVDHLMRWRNDPLLYVKEGFRDPDTGGELQLAPWSEELFGLIKDHDRVSVRAARGVGKTAGIVAVSYWRLTCFKNSRNIFTAPRREQMTLASWSEMRKWHRAMIPDLRRMFEIQTNKVVMTGSEGNESVATTVGSGNYEATTRPSRASTRATSRSSRTRRTASRTQSSTSSWARPPARSRRSC